MTPARFIAKREGDWRELEKLLHELENRPDLTIPSKRYLHFARLYRSVATDLSLSEAYLLPQATYEYLQGLVSRSHLVLYSFSRSRLQSVLYYITHVIPRSVFSDVHVWICQGIFWFSLFFSGGMAWHSVDFSRAVLGEVMMERAEEMHAKREDHSLGTMILASAGYLLNNGSIDLQVFALGSLGGVGALVGVLINGLFLGAMIGYLLTGPAAANILCWIAGHAVFELYAIGLSGGAGLRIGYAMIAAKGRSRLRALREEAVASIPLILSALILTITAGFIEAWIGPMKCEGIGSMAAITKIGIALASLLFIVLYFYVLGYFRYREEKLLPTESALPNPAPGRISLHSTTAKKAPDQRSGR